MAWLNLPGLFALILLTGSLICLFKTEKRPRKVRLRLDILSAILFVGCVICIGRIAPMDFQSMAP